MSINSESHVVTAAQVRESCQRNAIRVVNHHECSFCHYPVAYVVQDDRLYFDPGCACIDGGNRIELSDWNRAAEWINMQPTIEHKAAIAARFGIELGVENVG
jgi:hypothetical protein